VAGLGVVAERFRLERLAGIGGMGSIYRARDELTGATVAVKLLRGDELESRSRFLREAQLLEELNHPGIVRYVAHGQTPDLQIYLAMEWLEGEDLAQRLERARLSVDESMVLLGRLAGALAVAHAQGVVHRDINPTNVFLPAGRIGDAKILDFGVAKRGTEKADPFSTGAGVLVGTPGYMAPEQARGAGHVDARVDVFALGAVVYECLTGRLAFPGDSLMAVLAKILFDDPPPVRDVCPEVPRALEELLARLLAKEPARRAPDAGVVAAELTAIAESGQGIDRGEPALVLTAREQRLVCVLCAKRVGAGDAWHPPIAEDASGQAQEAPEPDAPDESHLSTLPAIPLSSLRHKTRAVPVTLLQALRQTASAHGARLEPLSGGAVVAVFESEGMATDQAARAARCAMAMRVLSPEAPMVLATGRAFLSRRWPVGEVIDRAVYLLGDAHPREGELLPIALDPVTAALLDARFDVRMQGTTPALFGERAGQESRTLLGKPTPCVGRERELAVLAGLFADCVSESTPRALLVTGAAGAGKSRLAREHLLRLRETERPEVLSGRGDPVGPGAPFGIVAQVVRGAANVFDGEPVEVRQDKVRRRVQTCVSAAEAERVSAFLCELAGAPLPDEHSAALRAARRDAMLMGDQLRRAWEDWLDAELVRPVVLVLENLQWGDLPSLRLVESALRNLKDKPFFVVALARPEVHTQFPGLFAEGGVELLSLSPLSRKASERLIRHVLGELAADRANLLIERAAGNAFFLEELIRGVAETQGSEPPDTVLAMIEARLQRFEPAARRVLRAASVFGQVFWEGGLGALLGGDLSPDELGMWIGVLVGREVVTIRHAGRFPKEREYAFRQELLREAAYAMLTDTDRALGHRLAGHWLESVGETSSLVLATHFERGGERERAVLCTLRAATQALEGNDFAAAIACVARGLACGAEGSVQGALLLALAEAHRWRGEFREAEEAAARALALVPPGSAEWYGSAAEVARASAAMGQVQRLVDMAELLLSRELGPGDARAIAALSLAGHLLHAGEYDRARRLLLQVERDPRGQGDAGVLAWRHAVRGIDAITHGDPATYLIEMEHAARCFGALGDLRRACLYEANVGYANLELGVYDAAEESLRNALAGARRLDLANITSMAAQNLGMALARRGCLDEALNYEHEAVTSFAQQGDRRNEIAARGYLATVLGLRGDLDAAEHEAARAVELATATPPSHAWALAHQAQVLAWAGKTEAALAAATLGMRLLGELGSMEEGESLLRVVHVEALERTGHREEARAALAKAVSSLHARAERVTDPRLRHSLLHEIRENARALELARTWLEEGNILDDEGAALHDLNR
jgi:tetratricopeptide (TPR) repeat protein